MELKIEHLSKQFKDKTAVNDVNLTLTPGVWGLLGANGAGKTTLMRMIADIMTPTNGAVYYDGKDIRELGEVYRSKFGFLPQDFGYHRDFTVKDYLEYMAALKDIPTRATTQKINHLLDILSLSDAVFPYPECKEFLMDDSSCSYGTDVLFFINCDGNFDHIWFLYEKRRLT